MAPRRINFGLFSPFICWNSSNIWSLQSTWRLNSFQILNFWKNNLTRKYDLEWNQTKTSSKGIPVSVWIPSHVEWIHANEVWIPSTLEWIHTQIASQTSELRCKNSFKKSHFLITISPQKNFLSNVILSCSRTDLVKYMHWLRMNSYHIGMNSFLIRMDSFRSRKQVCKNAFKVI